jgi:hypothetical protein
VIGLRQLYADTSELARWADPNSVASGTVRIYSTLENPNLLAGYLLPILPLALVALLRWQRPLPRLFALTTLTFGTAALVLTYSRGAWMGMVASLGVLGLLLAIRQRGATAGPPPIVVTGGGLAGQAGDARIGHEPNAVGTPPAPVLSLYLTDQCGAPPLQRNGPINMYAYPRGGRITRPGMGSPGTRPTPRIHRTKR